MSEVKQKKAYHRMTSWELAELRNVLVEHRDDLEGRQAKEIARRASKLLGREVTRTNLETAVRAAEFEKHYGYYQFAVNHRRPVDENFKASLGANRTSAQPLLEFPELEPQPKDKAIMAGANDQTDYIMRTIEETKRTVDRLEKTVGNVIDKYADMRVDVDNMPAAISKNTDLRVVAWLKEVRREIADVRRRLDEEEGRDDRN